MNRFRAAHASGDEWSRLVKQCGLELGPRGVWGNLGLIYVTEPLAADLPSILTFLRETTGIRHWVGGVGPGVCAEDSDYFDEPAMALLACDLSDGRFQVMPSIGADMGTLPDAVAAWRDSAAPRFGIMHADPRNVSVLSLVSDFAQTSGCFLVGGLTSAVADGQVADVPTGGGMSGVLFAEDVAVATGLTQGCSPIGPMREVTGVDGQVISELDGRPALEMLKQDVGEILSRDLRRIAGHVHAALPVPRSDTGDYLVRNLVGLDPSTGAVAVAAALADGDQMMFVRRDAEAARQDLVRMLGNLKSRIDGPPLAGVYHSCIARGPNQFGPGSLELTMIRDTLGDFPLVGFFGNGEISHNRLYTYTGVLTLFV